MRSSNTLSVDWTSAAKCPPGFSLDKTEEENAQHSGSIETNCIAERAVRRVKEGTATAMVQRGFPENGGTARWDVLATCRKCWQDSIRERIWWNMWRTIDSLRSKHQLPTSLQNTSLGGISSVKRWFLDHSCLMSSAPWVVR